MSVIRAFIAIDLPDEIRQHLSRVSHKLQQQLRPYPIRWVPPQNIHLTLKFLGDVSEHNLRMLTHLLAGEVETHRPFEFGVGTLGAFPDLRRPRVIWIGIEAPDELVAQLVALLVDRRTGKTDNNEPLGLLTHHLVHGADIWEFTRQLLGVLTSGPVTVYRHP